MIRYDVMIYGICKNVHSTQWLQQSHISLYSADKNHLPVWPLPWATTGLSPVRRFCNRGEVDGSSVASHCGCSYGRRCGKQALKYKRCVSLVTRCAFFCWANYANCQILAIWKIIKSLSTLFMLSSLIHALEDATVCVQEKWEGPALPCSCYQEVVQPHLAPHRQWISKNENNSQDSTSNSKPPKPPFTNWFKWPD